MRGKGGGGVLFTCGVCRHALLMASELECRVVYLCSGMGCMAKCACLLFMDIILATRAPPKNVVVVFFLLKCAGETRGKRLRVPENTHRCTVDPPPVRWRRGAGSPELQPRARRSQRCLQSLRRTCLSTVSPHCWGMREALTPERLRSRQAPCSAGCSRETWDGGGACERG